MKNKKLITLVTVCLVLLLALETSAQVKQIKAIGLYTFARVKGKIPTPEVMKMLADRYAGDIKYGFDLAGYGDIYLAFIDQLKSAQFEDTFWNPGERVQWMLFRSRGKIKVTGEAEWAGRVPVEVFAVKVRRGFKTYTFIIPKPCGNIALHSVVEEIPDAVCSLRVSPARANVGDPITVDMSGSQYAKRLRVDILDKQGKRVAAKDFAPEAARWQTKLDNPGEYVFRGIAISFGDKTSTNPCEGKVYINYPPVGKVVPGCLNCLEYVGRPLTFDATGSGDPDGEVTKVAFELTDANGLVVDSFVDTERPFVWQKTLLKDGNYTVAVTAYDNEGVASSATEDSRKTIKVTRKTFFVTLEGGPMMAHGSYQAFGFIRTGMYFWLSPDRASLAFTSGAGMPFKGAPWKPVITANLVGNVHLGPFFTGVGVGFMTKERSDRKEGIDALAQAGFTLSKSYLTIWQLFFEFRVPLGRSFEDCHKMSAGFRYNF